MHCGKLWRGRWEANDKGMSNPLPDLHVHSPSIPQQKVYETSKKVIVSTGA